MTKVTFENATLADVVRRASLVAPTRGDAFDRCAGIVIKVDPNAASKIVVMATDTVLFYMEAVTPVSIEGEAVNWRIPSAIFANMIGKLPIGAGATVSLDDSREPKRIVITHKRTVAKLNILDMGYYTLWEPYDGSDLVPIEDLGDKIKQVSWANTGREMHLDGIGIGRNFIGCTDKHRAALVEMDTGIDDDPFLVPSKTLASVIPQQGEVRVGRDGDLFLVMPNEFTQIRTSIIPTFFNLPSLVGKSTFSYTSTFKKSDALIMLGQALDFKGGDRLARVTMYLGKGELALHLDNAELGLFGSVIELKGDAETHKRVKIDFNPDNLRASLASFPTETVTIHYNEEKGKVYLTDGNGYHGLVAPLAQPKQEEKPDA